MNFYQQKYYKPYHQIVKIPPELYHQRPFGTPSRKCSHNHTPTSTKNTPKSNYYNQCPHHHQPYKPKSSSMLQPQYSDRQMAEPIWEYLYSEGIKSQKQILQRHEQTKHKVDTECTFKPMLRENKRYPVPRNSTFMERSNVWLENKIEKIVKEKQEEVNKGLKECTFTPQINKKSKKVKADNYQYQIHKKTCQKHRLNHSQLHATTRLSKSATKLGMSQSKGHSRYDYGPMIYHDDGGDRYYENGQNEEPLTLSRKKPQIEVNKVKQMIKNEIKRNALTFVREHSRAQGETSYRSEFDRYQKRDNARIQFYPKIHRTEQIFQALFAMQPEQDSNNKAVVAVGTTGAVVGATGVVGTAAGFTTSGIAAGSVAAGTQAIIGNVAAGSGFAVAQSLGATGVLAVAGPVGLAIGLVALGIGAFFGKNKQ